MNIRRVYKNMSILHKMTVLYILIITICISILTGIISANSTKTLRKIAQDSANQVMLSTYRSMISQINDINYIFATLQANRNLQAILRDAAPERAAYNVAEIDDILFETDVYGQKINDIKLYAIGHPEYSPVSTERVFSDRIIRNTQDYDEILSGDGAPRWAANDNNYASQSSITAMKLLTNSFNNEPLAIVRMDIDTTQFVAALQNLRLAETGQLFLCTSAGHIINPYENKFIAGFSHNPELRDLASRNTVGTVYCAIDAEDYMLTSYPLDDTGFCLIGAARLSEFKTQAQTIRTASFITAMFMAIVILLLLFYVSFYISKPITQMANNIDNFNPGRPQAVAYTQNDEIGKLYRSFNDMQTRIAGLTRDLSESLTIQKKAELKAIQAQITPHFLYNTLNSISALAQKHRIEEIEYMASSLATFFTRTLNNGNTFCTIRDELTHIQSYVNIQNVRFSNKFRVLSHLSEPLLSCQILNLTLQPLVENCIVHAFRGKPGIGTIRISGSQAGSDIYVEVADDGLGANVADVEYLNQYVNKPFNFDEQIEQYGIHNVNHRIKLYYGDSYGLSYSYNQYGGITATVHISDNKKGGNPL